MNGFSMSRHIDADPKDVFAVFTDFANAADRISGIERTEVLTPGEIGVGTRFRDTRKMFNREATETMEVSSFEADRSYCIRSSACGCDFLSTFAFEPDAGGTRVDFQLQLQPRGLFAKLMSPLNRFMLGPVQKCIQRDFDDLQACLEAGKFAEEETAAASQQPH